MIINQVDHSVNFILYSCIIFNYLIGVTMLFSNILLWGFLFIFSMIVNLMSFPLSPIIALLSLPKDKVPKIFNWWMTHDNPIDGDSGHLERWPGDTTWIKFKRRTAWLWRNKGYSFDYYVTGRVIGNHLTTHGDPMVSDRPLTKGVLFQYDENNTWEFYLIYPYPIKAQKCLRLRFGWKLDDLKVGTGERMMMATSIGIWKSYVKKEDS